MSDVIQEYQKEIIDNILSIDMESFNRFMQLLLDVYERDGQVFIAGNGGSAASANHFVCDFGKNAIPQGMRRFRIHSLADNIEVITALGNDISFDQIFAFQLGNLSHPQDLLIAVSASGNSPDIVNACKFAKEQGCKIVALSGFGGGKICDYADVQLVTDMRSYERIEDLHMMILHMAVCWFKNHFKAAYPAV